MDNDHSGRRRDLKGDARRNQILALLEQSDQDLTVEQIAAHFNVSFATVRRDLARLRGAEGVARTYGGVTLVRPHELSTRERRSERSAQKTAIGRVAADYVEDGDLVILDAGTTTTCVAEGLRGREDVTVVTNGIGVMTTLLEAPGVDIIALGGHLRAINETITGPVAEGMLRQVYAAVAFLGVDAIVPDRGVASRTPDQSTLKSLMMRRAARVVVVADSSKLVDGDFAYWSPLEVPWELVTDAGATGEQIATAVAAGAVQVVLAHDDHYTVAWPPSPRDDRG
ncbi:DeoR/GlpR family DNA-binding transcription regulator [Microbacterium sp.]|uniref:DeoR/GlpR family DNA-binding transcription regulator n=1 Tax=Microbacterium sp. TaxID=51671 RepID=UPI0039E6C2EF